MNGNHDDNAAPSAWVVRWSGLVPAGGRVLDIACGNGRHARLFAARGHPVAAVDRDLAKLARHIIRTYPEFYPIYGEREFTWNKIRQQNRNPLLPLNIGADGMKTGFICESGFNIVASATRDGRKLVAVVLGEQSPATRRVRATDLLENGFKRYFWKSLFGTSIDGLAIQASLTDGPAHLKDAICGVAKPKPSATRKVSRKGSKKRSTASTGAN